MNTDVHETTGVSFCRTSTFATTHTRTIVTSM